MRVLIVENNPALARIWSRHIQRHGATVHVSGTEAAAIRVLQTEIVDIIILDLVIEHGSAIAIADMASFRQPRARVIFVTNTTFFSDGSFFKHIPNACAFLPTDMAPEDLAAVVDHYGVVQEH